MVTWKEIAAREMFAAYCAEENGWSVQESKLAWDNDEIATERYDYWFKAAQAEFEHLLSLPRNERANENATRFEEMVNDERG